MPTGVFFAVISLLLLSGDVLAATIKREEPNNSRMRFARQHLVLRQSTPTDKPPCGSQADCLATVSFNVSQSLVSCKDGMCECKECFMYDPGKRKCFNCSDYLYFSSNGTCGSDNRQDQRRAFFLSFFFSAFGAANFYIRSYGLASGQVIVLIVFIASVIVVICPCCICCGCVNKEGAIKGTCLFIVLFILSVAFVIIMGALIVSWWIGDLSVFAGNERKTGSGCFPRANL